MQDVGLLPLHLDLLVLLLFDTNAMLELNRYLFQIQIQNIDQYYIGQFFEEGKGRDIDLIQALFWYRKAAAQGDQDAIGNVARLAGQVA